MIIVIILDCIYVAFMILKALCSEGGISHNARQLHHSLIILTVRIHFCCEIFVALLYCPIAFRVGLIIRTYLIQSLLANCCLHLSLHI